MHRWRHIIVVARVLLKIIYGIDVLMGNFSTVSVGTWSLHTAAYCGNRVSHINREIPSSLCITYLSLQLLPTISIIPHAWVCPKQKFIAYKSHTHTKLTRSRLKKMVK